MNCAEENIPACPGKAGGRAWGRDYRAETLSVIVPVHGDADAGRRPFREVFRRCLQSLSSLDPAPDEVIVVADGDLDAADVAEQFGFVVIRQAPWQKCLGPAGARNLGAGLARGDILFFVDADVAVPTDAVSQVMAAFSADEVFSKNFPGARARPSALPGQAASGLAGAGGVDAVVGSYDDEPGATNFLSQYRNLLHHFVHQTARAEASTFWGACGAIRRSVFLAAGGFDSRYTRPCVEDIELGYRLKQAGRRIRLVKSLQVKHWKRWDSVSLLRTDFFQRALPWTELILRRRWFINDLNLRFSSRFSVLLAWGLVAAMAAALWWPKALLAAAAMAVALLVLNASLYRFFWTKRGPWFAAGAAAWHWFYYLYGGLAFGIGLVGHCLGQAGLRRESPVPPWHEASKGSPPRLTAARCPSEPRRMGNWRPQPGHEAAYWDAVLVDMQGRRQGLWRRYCESVHGAWLREVLPTGRLRRVLKTDLFDEAMGGGLYEPLAARADHVTGVDIAPGICRAAAARHAGLEAIQSDVRHLPFPDDAFDAIVSNSTLDHFGSSGEIAAAVRELARVLSPGGVLALTLDNPANPAVLLRGLLPQHLLNDLGIVPYQVGAPCGRRRLEQFVRQAGLKVKATSAILHCPRAPAVAAAGLLADANPRLQERFLRVLAAMERLGSLPTRYLTGHFTTVLAVKRLQPAMDCGLDGPPGGGAMRPETTKPPGAW